MSARGFSIRTRLIALVLAVLLPALCAAAWVLSLTYRMERESSEHVLEETTRALSMVLDRELTQRAVVVRALASSSLLDTAPQLSPAALRDFDQQARRTLTGLEGWLELRSADQVLVNTRQPPGTRPRAGPRLALVDRPMIQPLRQDAALGIQYAALVQPVLREGQAVLNLSLTMLPNEFQRIIDEQRLPAGWLAAIIDNQGRVVARHPGGGVHIGRPATADLKAHLDAEREGLMHSVSLDGNPVTLYFHTSPQGWTYVTGMSREQFEGTVPRAVLQVAAAMLALLVVSLIAAAWVARRIVQPIHTIEQMALDLREGRPLRRTRTGLLECDQVALALHDAGHAIRHARIELERQVSDAVERTRKLEQRASHNHRVEALGRLTGGIAHEFNNLLGIISNCAHLMRRLAPAPAIQPAIDATLSAVDTGSRLTQHLLRFAGRQTVHPRVMQLQTFLPETAELLRTLLDRRVTLTTEVDENTPAVQLDPSELELSLINLALNAREAIPAHGHLWLRAAAAEPDDLEGLPSGSYVRITLRDDGHGMDDTVAHRAFEPFFSTREPHEVAGLGLSQVYGFCLQAGGRARLESMPGLGTTVTLVLPAHTGEPADARAALPVSPAAIAGTRLLLVEDNEALCEATAAVLRSYGCDVVCTASAEDALRLIDTPPGFDVVVTDVLMPGKMDGVALANHLRQILPQLPVVLISGHHGDTSPPPGVRLLRKPCPPEVLAGAIEAAIAQRPL
ncbi:response regulator [Hydrogenophaga sp. UC242_53]|uniref:response regulator n=1 Tax=Hydrogenophaga sp. UC242_53 TaxID=3350170 RepID=UPI0036D2D8E9